MGEMQLLSKQHRGAITIDNGLEVMAGGPDILEVQSDEGVSFLREFCVSLRVGERCNCRE